jgi:MFS family permease
MQSVAQGWVVVGLTSSATTVAFVMFVSSLPMIALSLHGGLVADRFSRRKVLIVTQVLLALLAAAYGTLVATHTLTLAWVYVLALGLGAVIAFDLPAAGAMVPDLVPAADVPRAFALNMAAFHAARLVGPSLAAILIASLGTASAFYVNAISYLAVIWSLSVIRPTAQRPAADARGLSGLVEGLRYIRATPLTAAIIGFTGISTMFIFPLIIVFMPLVVKQVFHGDEKALGSMMSGAGLGAMLGALTLLRVPSRARGVAILLSAAGAGVMLFAITLARTPWQATALVPVMSYCVAVSIGLGATILQITAPGALRGRVLAVHTLMWTGLMPSAALGLGLLADRLDLRATLRLMAGAYLILGVGWLLRVRIWATAGSATVPSPDPGIPVASPAGPGTPPAPHS